MSETFSPETPRQLLIDLGRLVSQRAEVEKAADAALAMQTQAAEQEYREAQAQLDKSHHEERAAAEQQYAAIGTQTAAKYEADRGELEKEYETVRKEALARAATDERAAEQALQDAHWKAIESSDAARGSLNLPLAEVLAELDGRWQELANIHQQAVNLLYERGHWDEFPAAQPVEVLLEKHPGRRFSHALEQARGEFAALSNQSLPRLFHGFRPWGLVLAVWVLSSILPIALLGGADWRWLPISAGFTALFCSIVGALLSQISLRRSTAAYLTLRHTLLQAGLGYPAVLEAAKAECQRLDASVLALHRSQNEQAEETHTAAMARIEACRQAELEKADREYPQRMADLLAWHDRTLKENEEGHPLRLRQIDERHRAESERLRARHDGAIEEGRQRFEQQWAEMAGRWQSGLAQFQASLDGLDAICREAFPDWHTADWRRFALAKAIPPVIRFGHTEIDLARIEGGTPEDKRLQPARSAFDLPLLLPYPRRSLLMLKARGPGRAQAVDMMQGAMLRMLTAMPPGKVRFTIFDPVGLGDNFSAFMHLADYDQQLVASRIWTDTDHIEQRLADLTKHMEDVIQVYLRKEFHSIEEYNAFAGEMAEPYRVLVVANFPANFSEAAAHRVKSIVASGARCGVFVLLSVDMQLPLPHNFALNDVEPDALVLRCEEEQLLWDPPEAAGFKPVGPKEESPPSTHREATLRKKARAAPEPPPAVSLPLRVEFDPPPAPDRFKEILQTIGEAAKHGDRVEVPFSCIIPEPKDWWTGDSRGGLDVPLGRAGAMKFQNLGLGAGTSQHVLISGKTGSGKSTLLHVLITNLALRYSPHEVELYLVDFKKGVEFKAYARCELPHARVIAVESEREFGLSVLQRLDAELRSRGDLFRKHGVQDLKGYRAAEPQAVMPRVLLIIDEFQELFVEDDRIAQESALLLDRLVRQGRAFGIHILLGSQTLGGAYTLARSTIGQMAVRIALQCSEADAHLILSEDNTAARLLTRPGEAIYNDANGLYEGNHPFQVVWLSDGDRDAYLQQVRTLAEQKHCSMAPPIVFEGNILADPNDNPKLKELLTAKSWPESAPAVHAWLGSAVAIKDPTSAVFLRQNASNLLIVGHREEAALGAMASCFVSLAAQLSPLSWGEGSGPRFYILDGIRSDAPEVGFWNRVAAVAPQAVKIADVRGAAEIVNEIASELASRREEGRDNGPPIYLFLYNLGRFRDLRKEDDYGFSGDKAAGPAQQFTSILRDGPPLGIHSVIWCDTYSNVSRMLDRQSLRDFEMRVLFQMNANDSSSLMDTPDASRLGVHRALFYDEGQGRMEKFRPYGLPSPEWLAFIAKQLRDR